MSTAYIGTEVSRVDGPAKVSGAAKYAGEFNYPGLLYGFVVSSAIAQGEIESIDTKLAMSVEGAVEVFTHKNRPHLAYFDRSYLDQDAPTDGSPLRPLYDNKVLYSGQPIALAVAESFEVARYMASLVDVRYKAEHHETDLHIAREQAVEIKKSNREGIEPPPGPRGDSAKAFASARIQIENEYSTPSETHNPLEPFATTVLYHDDGTLTIYDKTQGVSNSQEYVSKIFGYAKKEVRVLSPFVGGAFGSGLRPQYQLYLAVMAVKALERSVRVTLTRDQMFTLGHRPETLQQIRIGGDEAGLLKSIQNTTTSETSRYENYFEAVTNWSGLLYHCDNLTLEHKIASVDSSTPCDMRAPGAAQGVYALETAMDELAVATGVDPLELRIRNHSEKDENQGKKYSSKELKECYRQAAERFGWDQRRATPRTEKRGTALVGRGMASGVWEAQQQQAQAKAMLTPDCRLTVASGTSDIGTGSYTMMAIIGAETLGLPLSRVDAKLGDSDLPTAPLEGGSWTVSSVGTAVSEACTAVAKNVFKLARGAKNSPLARASFEDVVFANERISLRSDPTVFVSMAAALAEGEGKPIEEVVSSSPSKLKQLGYVSYTHSAVFVEVEVDEDFGTVSVTRVVSAIAGGRVINLKAARSQVIGGIVWGIGMALQEHTFMDHQLGRFMNHNLAEYHVPVNADIHGIEVVFVDEHDDIVNPIGAKGLGEIGIVGVAAAISNAVFNATGKRVRDLPITLDKLI